MNSSHSSIGRTNTNSRPGRAIAEPGNPAALLGRFTLRGLLTVLVAEFQLDANPKYQQLLREPLLPPQRPPSSSSRCIQANDRSLGATLVTLGYLALRRRLISQYERYQDFEQISEK